MAVMCSREAPTDGVTWVISDAWFGRTRHATGMTLAGVPIRRKPPSPADKPTPPPANPRPNRKARRKAQSDARRRSRHAQ